jgi:hypothetical protein
MKSKKKEATGCFVSDYSGQIIVLVYKLYDYIKHCLWVSQWQRRQLLT